MSPCVHKIFERHGAWPCAAPENIYLMRKCARAAALCRWHLPKVTLMWQEPLELMCLKEVVGKNWRPLSWTLKAVVRDKELIKAIDILQESLHRILMNLNDFGQCLCNVLDEVLEVNLANLYGQIKPFGAKFDIMCRELGS
jgi:hypothetical protein